MGPDEPLPDDVRRLLENESPAVMARELLRARELADSRAWLVVELAQTAGVKVTIDEVKRGARTLASVCNAAGVAILETRRLAGKHLARKDEDIIDGAATAAQIRADRMQAERDEAQAEIERLRKLADTREDRLAEVSTQSTSRGEAIVRVAREAGVIPDGGNVIRLADEAVAAICRMRKEREDLVHVNSVKVVAEDAARMAAELAEARAEVERLRKDLAETRKDREEARAGAKGVWEDLSKARVEATRLRAGLSELAGDVARAERRADAAEAEVKRLQATDLYKTAAHETRQILSAALGVHADGVPITDLPRQAREVVRQRNAEKSRAYLRDAAIDDANRVLDGAGVPTENSIGRPLTLWDRVELLVAAIAATTKVP